MNPSIQKLICLPPAGAGPSIFGPLHQFKKTNVEIKSACYPGRETRHREPFVESIESLANMLAKELLPQTETDSFALLGYSMGGLVGYELIRRWSAWGMRLPSHFFVLAARPPHRSFERGIHSLPKSEFHEMLVKMGGTPREILENDEAMAIFEPVLRHDFELCDNYCIENIERIGVPITSIVSDCDALVSVDDAQSWGEFSGQFQLQILDGSPHILSRDILQEVVAALLV